MLRWDSRSRLARESDKAQEKNVAQRQWVFGVTLWTIVLLEAALWYWQIETWILVVIPLLWLGLLIHSNSLLILHELWEINDQLAGRKDEFRNLIVNRNPSIEE
jgi:hypothetical protein